MVVLIVLKLVDSGGVDNGVIDDVSNGDVDVGDVGVGVDDVDGGDVGSGNVGVFVDDVGSGNVGVFVDDVGAGDVGVCIHLSSLLLLLAVVASRSRNLTCNRFDQIATNLPTKMIQGAKCGKVLLA